MTLRRLAALAAMVVLAGCQPPKSPTPTPTPSAASAPAPRLELKPVSFAALPGWAADNAADALGGFVAGCRAMQASEAAPLGGQGEAASRGGTAAQWQDACTAAGRVPVGNDGAARQFFEATFQPYAVGDASAAEADRTQGLFTGYFEPQVTGSRSPGGAYRTPLLGRPGDLVQVDLGDFVPDLKGRSIAGRVQDGRLVPYFDRAQIEGGALARRRLELVWLTDPIDAFVLQIQGSGRVDLPGGKVVRVTYAGQNGRPYVPIGRVLADRGDLKLDEVSLQTIRAWLVAHPQDAAAVMNQNPSYVFFREIGNLKPDQGPPGALGAALLPGRSVAVDRAFVPLGAPLFIATTDPLTGAPWQHMMVAQDLGGAIRGPVRADIFFGWGKQAEAQAGRMRQHGTEYLLLPAMRAAATP